MLGRTIDLTSLPTHALLTLAELRLVKDSAQVHYAPERLETSSSQKSSVSVGRVNDHSTMPRSTSMDITESRNFNWTILEINPSIGESLFNLRARYSRVLFRIAVQISNYSTGHIHIGADILIKLLESLKEEFQCPSLNPPFPMSTNQMQVELPPKTNQNSFPTLCAVVMGTDGYTLLRPTTIGDEDGLIVGLLQIISQHNVRESHDLAMAARKALHVITPILFRQWFSTGSRSNMGAHALSAGPLQFLKDWPTELTNTELDLDEQDIWTMHQILIITQTSLSCMEYEGIDRLPLEALRTLCQISKGASGQLHAYEAFRRHHNLVSEIITTVTENIVCIDKAVIGCLAELLFPEPTAHPILRSPLQSLHCNHTECYIRISKLWTKRADLSAEFQRFMEGLKESWHDLNGSNVLGTLVKSNGFLDLIELGKQEHYAQAFAPHLADIIETAFQQAPNGENGLDWGPWLDNHPFPGILTLVESVIDNTPRAASLTFSASFIHAAGIYLEQLHDNEDHQEASKLVLQVYRILSNESISHCSEKEALILKCTEWLGEQL